MARYDVYQGSDDILLLYIQADLLDQLKTRIVVPLILHDKAPQPAQRLNPIFKIVENEYVTMTSFHGFHKNHKTEIIDDQYIPRT
ncbi:toxin CcdB [Bartonella apihabitans]|uniref:CcdB family protein n=1 Tax=Bartonella apihabitans TaxID=2750929 RepID=UPI0009C1D19E|nr:CcdB family protein [Bartonella apihabitans]AQT44810.1 toxin CcdB [Bartonella apihabitans]